MTIINGKVKIFSDYFLVKKKFWSENILIILQVQTIILTTFLSLQEILRSCCWKLIHNYAKKRVKEKSFVKKKKKNVKK